MIPGVATESHPALSAAPVVAAGVVAAAAVLAGATAVTTVVLWLLTYGAGVAVLFLRPASPERPAPWRLHARWRARLQQALAARSAHRRAAGMDAEQDLIDQLVLDVWAIGRWATAALRSAAEMTDGTDRARLRDLIADADTRIDQAVERLREASAAAVAQQLEREAPPELTASAHEDLERLADSIASYRAALGEVRSLP